MGMQSTFSFSTFVTADLHPKMHINMDHGVG